MNEFIRKARRVQAETIIKALERRRIRGVYVETAAEARQWLINHIPEGTSISWGDSLTLDALDVKDHFRKGAFTVFDRDAPGSDVDANVELRTRIMRQALSADYFLVGANAITLKGEIINIDGRGNRAAAICFGPDHVIFTVGVNKITADVESGIQRVRTDACVPNAIRHGRNTPCALTGKCAECTHDDCMCCQILVTRCAKIPGRYTVLLIGEEMGF